MKLSELAQRLGCELRGDGEVEILRAAPIETAGRGDISFVANPKYQSFLNTTKASALALSTSEPWDQLPSLRAENPYLLFAGVVDVLHPDREREAKVAQSAVVAPVSDIHETVAVGECSVIGERTTIGQNTRIDANVTIGENVRIGSDCHLYPGVIVLDDSVLGDGVTLHAGTVIGSDGFGYASGPRGHKKIRQIGNVVIEDNVEIGANCAVDRAALGSTVIGAGTKVDNLVQIAHNVRIGKNCLIVSQVGISGSSVLGDWVTLAGQVGVVGHINLGDHAVAAAQAGVTKDIPANTTVFGSPAREISGARKAFAATRKLPDLLRRLSKLERRLKELEST